MSFALSHEICSSEVFLTPRAGLGQRWDPNYYRCMSIFRARIESCPHPIQRLNESLSTVQYGISERATAEAVGVPMLRMINLQSDSWDLSDLKYIAMSKAEIAPYLLRFGDILFNRTNSKELVGKCCVFNLRGEYVFASYLIRVQLKHGLLIPDYVAAYLASPLGRIQIDAVSRQIAGMTNINAEEIRNLLLPVPSPAVQEVVAKAWRDAIRLRDETLESARKLLSSTDDLLLQELGIERREESPNITENIVFHTTFRQLTGARWDSLFHQGDMFHFIRKAKCDLRTLGDLVLYFLPGFAAGPGDQSGMEGGIIQIRPTNLSEDRELIFLRNIYLTPFDLEKRPLDVLQRREVLFNNTNSQELVGKTRIDGNHRLAASKDAQVRKRVTPFCIVFCRDPTEFRRFSSSLFHNINYKQVPLPKEHNLRLILDDTDLFPDDKLKEDPSFGWPYYQARKLHNHLDLELLPNLKPLIEPEPRSFLIDQFSYLGEKGVLNENEHAIKRFKESLARVNALFDEQPALKNTHNRGLLIAFLYYVLKSPRTVAALVHWIVENRLYRIEQSNPNDLIQIFDQILLSKSRTIFVSLAIGKSAAEKNFKVIKRICDEVSVECSLQPALKVERVDAFHDGTSYSIADKILEMINDSGLLIGDLTYGNLSVYHEIGFAMGKAKAEGKPTANILLFLDESVLSEKDKTVGFNLQGIKQLRFSKTDKFASDLRKNIKLYFNAHSD